VEVFPEDVADMKSVTFRVIASDGFNSAEVTSQTVQP
jgi:hypothetical protein